MGLAGRDTEWAGPRGGCAKSCTQTSHSDEESYRNVKIFDVCRKIHFESVRLWYRFEKSRKSIFIGFSGGKRFSRIGEIWSRIGEICLASRDRASRRWILQILESPGPAQRNILKGIGEISKGFEEIRRDLSRRRVQNLDFY